MGNPEPSPKTRKGYGCCATSRRGSVFNGLRCTLVPFTKVWVATFDGDKLAF